MEKNTDKIRSSLKNSVFQEEKFTDADKSEVRRKIQRKTRTPRWIPAAARLAAALSFLTLGLWLLLGDFRDASDPGEQPGEGIHTSGQFTTGDLAAGPFKPDTTYYAVLPFAWSGNSPAAIQSIGIVKGSEEQLSAADGISYTVYTADAEKKTGVYERNDIGKVSPADGVTMKDERTLVLKFTLRDVVPDKSRALKIRYVENDAEKEQTLVLGFLQGLETVPVPDQQDSGAVILDSAERNVYSSLKFEPEGEHVQGLSPMSVAKLYIHALYERDYDIAYALYTDRNDHIQWSKSDDAQIPEADRPTLAQVKQQFRNFETGRFLQTSPYEGYVEFYPEGTDEEPSGFAMIKNENDSWQVAFMPLQ